MHIFTANMHLYVFICVLCFVIEQKVAFPNNFAKYQSGNNSDTICSRLQDKMSSCVSVSKNIEWIYFYFLQCIKLFLKSGQLIEIPFST